MNQILLDLLLINKMKDLVLDLMFMQFFWMSKKHAKDTIQLLKIEIRIVKS